MKILSVDDSATMRRIIGRSIAMLGHGFLEAGNAEEALALLRAEHKDVGLAILDINMPGMDGIELLRTLKADPEFKRIPVMMVTTDSDRTRIIQAVQAGAANYVTKPFSQDDLVAKILDTLGSDEF